MISVCIAFLSRVWMHVLDLYMALKSLKVYLLMIPIQTFINTYVFDEWNFALGFFMIFLIDTWTGIYVAWRQKQFSTKILRDKLLDKGVAYFSLIMCWSIGTKIVLNGDSEGILQYLDLAFYNIFVVAEIFSIIQNWYKYKQWPVLAKLMKHFKGFDDETGEIREHN